MSASVMPEFGLVLTDHDGTPLEQSRVTLNKAPGRGSWFDVGDGVAARCDDKRIIAGDLVLYASLDRPGGPPRLKRDRSPVGGAARWGGGSPRET